MSATKKNLQLAIRFFFMSAFGCAFANNNSADALLSVDNQKGDPIYIQIDTKNIGENYDLEFRANLSRLPALFAISESSDLVENSNPVRLENLPAGYLKAWYPYADFVRIGNMFFGYDCMGIKLEPLAVRGTDGSIEYQFGETIEMLGYLLEAGLKPHIALTGQPSALASKSTRIVKHPVYGCTNAPEIDFNKKHPRDRLLYWDDMVDAFFRRLIEVFGYQEVVGWSFATWTEPHGDRKNENGHIVFPDSVIEKNQSDDFIATIIAASIDIAKKYKLPIHIGNLAGPVSIRYPRIINKIRQFPSGNEYLDYLDGYAVSIYKTGPRNKIKRKIESAISLLRDPVMPDKPILIDEFGYLQFDDGSYPEKHIKTPTRKYGVFVARALEMLFDYNSEGKRRPKSIAFWDNMIMPRAKNRFKDIDKYLNTPASNVITFFSTLKGFARANLGLKNENVGIVAGVKGSATKVILFNDSKYERAITANIKIKGLKPNSDYFIQTSRITGRYGNPIRIFLDGKDEYHITPNKMFVEVDNRWRFSSVKWKNAYMGDGGGYSWRKAADKYDNYIVTGEVARTKDNGVLTVAIGLDYLDVAMVDIIAYADYCNKTEVNSIRYDFQSLLSSTDNRTPAKAEMISFEYGNTDNRTLYRDGRELGIRLHEGGLLSYRCSAINPYHSAVSASFMMPEKIVEESESPIISERLDGDNAFLLLTEGRNVVAKWILEGNEYEVTKVIPEENPRIWNSVTVKTERGKLHLVLNGADVGAIDIPVKSIEEARRWRKAKLYIGSDVDGRIFQGILDDVDILGK